MELQTFIFVDGSYYCFYRYFALLKWWKNAYPDEELTDPYNNTKFVDKFKKTFVENLVQMPKKLGLKTNDKPIIIVGKDCNRVHIWRNDIFANYKANRANGIEDGFMGGPFFKLAYDDELFIKGGARLILSHSRLEADDCIALYVKSILNKNPTSKIYIITSDRDYLQLNAHNVQLFTLTYKNLVNGQNVTGNAAIDLKMKILMGDSSDNIPSVFPKCGPKTALKCIQDNDYFKKKMNKNILYCHQYNLNEQLIDFNKIPECYVVEFNKKYDIN